MEKPKLYVIAGPTASGKTAAAAALAREIGGEVISADSMQVYRGMDIGTAKPTPADMAGVPHHMLSVVDPDAPFSAARFQELATAAAGDILSRGKIPILAGGTGFYINAVLYGAEFSAPHERETQLRQSFAALAREKGTFFLHARLAQADPAAAAAIHPNNIKRAARALAYCEATGGLFSAHNAAQKAKPPLFDAQFFLLSMSREALYRRINRRVTAMFEAGLAGEVRALLLKYSPGLAAMQGIGYKETIQFIHGERTQAQAIASIQQATRRYAKRQETWFRHHAPAARSLDAENKTPEELAAEISAAGERWRSSH